MYSLNREKFLNEIELETLKKSIQDKSRNSILIRLALETGARASELLNLRPSDFTSQTCSVYIKALKGSRDREVPISKELFEDVTTLFKGSDKVFNITYSRLVQIWDWYRPSKKTFHCLRHTFAIELYKSKRDGKAVQICLGHKSISTTAIYIDFVYSVEELRKILGR